MFWIQTGSRVAGSGCLGLMRLAEVLHFDHKEQLGIPLCLGLSLLHH